MSTRVSTRANGPFPGPHPICRHDPSYFSLELNHPVPQKGVGSSPETSSSHVYHPVEGREIGVVADPTRDYGHCCIEDRATQVVVGAGVGSTISVTSTAAVVRATKPGVTSTGSSI